MSRGHQPREEDCPSDERWESRGNEVRFQEIDFLRGDIGWGSLTADEVMNAYQDSHRIAASNRSVMVRLLEGFEDDRRPTGRENSEMRVQRITTAIQRLSDSAKASNRLTISSLEQVNGALEDLDLEIRAHARTRRSLEKKKHEIQALKRQLNSLERANVRHTDLIRTIQGLHRQRNGFTVWITWSAERAIEFAAIVLLAYLAFSAGVQQSPGVDPYRYIH